jgi:hypothetical protein
MMIRATILGACVALAMTIFNGCGGVGEGPASAPVIQSITATGIPAMPGATVTTQVSATSALGTSLAYSWTATPGWTLTGGGNSASATFSAPKSYSATGSATVVITDSKNNASQAAVALSTSGDPLPTITSVVASPNPVSVEGTQTITATASSPTNDTLTYNWTTPPGWTIVSGQGTSMLTVSAASDYGATGDFLVAVSNPSGGTVEGDAAVSTGTDIVTSVEMAPTAQSGYLVGSPSPSAGFTLYGDKEQMFSVTAYDPDHVAILGPNAPQITVSGTPGLSVAPPSESSPNVWGATNVAFGTSEALTLTATPYSGIPVAATVPILTRHNVFYTASSGTPSTPGAVNEYYDENTTAFRQIAMPVGDGITGLAAGANGTLLVSVDGGGISTSGALVYSGGGTSAAYQTVLGMGSGHLQGCIDHEGNYYLPVSADPGYVEEFPASGQNTVIATYSGQNMNTPISCAIDGDDGLWVVNGDSDNGDSFFLVFHFPAGSTTPDQSWSIADPSIYEPLSIAVDRSNTLYVGVEGFINGSFSQAVEVYPKASPSLEFTVTMPCPDGTSFASPLGIAVDIAGNVWVAEYYQQGGAIASFQAPLSATSTPTITTYPGTVRTGWVGVSPSQ